MASRFLPRFAEPQIPLRVTADQDQKAFEQSALDERLQELAQQVTDFARQHEQQAAALQAQLHHLDTQVGLLTTQYDIIARRLVGAGLNRIRQHIAQRQQARDGPSR